MREQREHIKFVGRHINVRLEHIDFIDSRLRRLRNKVLGYAACHIVRSFIPPNIRLGNDGAVRRCSHV